MPHFNRGILDSRKGANLACKVYLRTASADAACENVATSLGDQGVVFHIASF